MCFGCVSQLAVIFVGQTDFNEAASTESLHMRLPAVAKIALASAWTMLEAPGFPICPGGAVFRTMYTSIARASLMRTI
jgi:hypothetical protein